MLDPPLLFSFSIYFSHHFFDRIHIGPNVSAVISPAQSRRPLLATTSLILAELKLGRHALARNLDSGVSVIVDHDVSRRPVRASRHNIVRECRVLKATVEHPLRTL